MARLPRLCVPNWPHLLIQRGHNRQPVFADEADSQLFLALLREVATTHRVAVHAYALHPAEVRLLVTPQTADGLSRVMQSLGRRYGTHFNRRHNHAGSLWEGRFRATPIDPEHYLLDAMRFVEEGGSNDVASTHLVHVSASSLPHHLGQRVDPLITDHVRFWGLGNTPFEREAGYRRLMDEGLRAATRAQLAQAVEKGWPLGTPEFIERLAVFTDRRLAPLPRGRPKKAL